MLEKDRSIIRIITIVFTLIILTGCSSKNNSLPKNIIDKSWERKGSGDTEVIYFGKDNHFSYYETSGSPVGDYDLCESYKYNNGKITLQCSDKNIPKDIEVISQSKDELVLKINGKRLTFKLSEEQ